MWFETVHTTRVDLVPEVGCKFRSRCWGISYFNLHQPIQWQRWWPAGCHTAAPRLLQWAVTGWRPQQTQPDRRSNTPGRSKSRWRDPESKDCRFLRWRHEENQCRVTPLHSLNIWRGPTRLVVKQTADASLRGVEEGRGHGVVLSVGTEELWWEGWKVTARVVSKKRCMKFDKDS